MKKYLVIVKTYDGEFEYLDKTIMALDCDPNDSKQVLIEIIQKKLKKNM
jgi:hypothetical protein